jgi:hypothetical protein
MPFRYVLTHARYVLPNYGVGDGVTPDIGLWVRPTQLPGLWGLRVCMVLTHFRCGPASGLPVPQVLPAAQSSPVVPPLGPLCKGQKQVAHREISRLVATTRGRMLRLAPARYSNFCATRTCPQHHLGYCHPVCILIHRRSCSTRACCSAQKEEWRGRNRRHAHMSHSCSLGQGGSQSSPHTTSAVPRGAA